MWMRGACVHTCTLDVYGEIAFNPSTRLPHVSYSTGPTLSPSLTLSQLHSLTQSQPSPSPNFTPSLSPNPHPLTNFTPSLSPNPHSLTNFTPSLSLNPHPLTNFTPSLSPNPHPLTNFTPSLSQTVLLPYKHHLTQHLLMQPHSSFIFLFLTTPRLTSPTPSLPTSSTPSPALWIDCSSNCLPCSS